MESNSRDNGLDDNANGQNVEAAAVFFCFSLWHLSIISAHTAAAAAHLNVRVRLQYLSVAKVVQFAAKVPSLFFLIEERTRQQKTAACKVCKKDEEEKTTKVVREWKKLGAKE